MLCLQPKPIRIRLRPVDQFFHVGLSMAVVGLHDQNEISVRLKELAKAVSTDSCKATRTL